MKKTITLQGYEVNVEFDIPNLNIVAGIKDIGIIFDVDYESLLMFVEALDSIKKELENRVTNYISIIDKINKVTE